MNIYTKRPEGFDPKLMIVSTYCQWEESVLLLKRAPHDTHGLTWCLPGGEHEVGETEVEAALRELHEETGIILPSHHLSKLGDLYFCFPETHYAMAIYHVDFREAPEVTVDLREHTKGEWFKHGEFGEIDLIRGGAPVLEFCKLKMMERDNG